MSQKVGVIARLVGLFLVMPLWTFFGKIATMDSDIAVAVGFLGFGVLALFVGMCLIEFVKWLVNQIEKETT